ncbi:MAG: 50S ribosomal protein L3 [Anaerolineae bacterium]|nr:50S ribosomal protein L3 [Anaerolineae bacterium]MCO5187316.1 50S ribosomal protein L3 [Anaerolineae bacterium]MCO5193902.1 50S ribosomal protein L3 [Anaerolineae bacterium]MCO5204481.1 50S ribosomal protein L3 [Anaerolineae bacterium]
MMKSILGIKVGMTQLFGENGAAIPVTIIQAGPCYVTQVKTVESDGYNAVQVGFHETKPMRVNKPQRGHLGQLKPNKKHPTRKQGADIPPVRYFREFRTRTAEEYSVGQQLTVEQFVPGDKVDVTGKTKGRGFAGVVKRYGFGGGPKTHGQSDRWRAPGSIGATSGNARVFKGKRMPGRYGGDRHTVQNLEVVRIDSEKNLIAVKGAVPGVKGGLVIVRDAVKG